MILVTGATGFLGHSLLHTLVQAGYDLRALHRPQPSSRATSGSGWPVRGLGAPAGVEWVPGDVLDVPSLEAALDGVTHVIHGAAVVSFLKRDRETLRAVNVTGTANVVNVSLQVGVQKLVYLSSIAALSRPEELSAPLDEAQPWVKSKRNSHYGRSKYLGELEVHRGVAEGLPAVIANLGTVIGPGNFARSSGEIIPAGVKGQPFVPGGSNGYVSTRDVAQAVRLLLESDYNAAERFLVVGENVSYKDLFTWIAEAAGKRPPRSVLPDTVVRGWGRLSGFLGWLTRTRPLLTPANAIFLTERYQYNSAKFRDAFQYEFQPIREAVQEAVAAYQQTRP